MWDRLVKVRCCRCRRVIGRLGDGWFQPNRPLAKGDANLSAPPVYQFPGRRQPPSLADRPLLSVEIVELTNWTLPGVRCGCRRRDGSPMTYTLSLDLMEAAARFDQRRSDLIAGAPNYGLRPERRIEGHQLRRLGYPVPASEDRWLSPPDGHDSWTAVVAKSVKSDRQLTDEPAAGTAMPGATGPPSAGSVARSPG